MAAVNRILRVKNTPVKNELVKMLIDTCEKAWRYAKNFNTIVAVWL